MPESLAAKVPPYVIVEVEGPNGQKRKVALVGLLTEDRNLYRPGAFAGGFETVEPVAAAAK